MGTTVKVELQIEALFPSETLVSIYQTTHCFHFQLNLEDGGSMCLRNIRNNLSTINLQLDTNISCISDINFCAIKAQI
jgi:hypothetical protein